MDTTAQLYLMTSRVEKNAVKNSDWSYEESGQTANMPDDVFVLILWQKF